MRKNHSDKVLDQKFLPSLLLVIYYANFITRLRYGNNSVQQGVRAPMFKVKMLLFTASILITGCAIKPATQSDLFGVWKSNESKTLDSMRNAVGVSEKAKELFEKDFFGHLKAEYRVGEARYYFDREEDNVEGMEEFKPYDLIEENENILLLNISMNLKERK